MDAEHLSFCPRLQEMIESGKCLDQEGQVKRITAVSTLGNLRVIRELLLREQFTTTLEIGLAFGGSALTFLATLAQTSSSGFHHSAIDPYQTKRWGGCALRAISEEGFAEHFTFYEDYSAFVLPELTKAGHAYDLIYIDGSHRFEDVFVDFYFCSRLLKKEGILLFDDCCDSNVKKVIRFISKNCSEFLIEIDYTSVENPKKSLKKRLGNRLGMRQLRGYVKKAKPHRKWDSPLKNF